MENMINLEKVVDGKWIRFYNLRGFGKNLASHRRNLWDLLKNEPENSPRHKNGKIDVTI